MYAGTRAYGLFRLPSGAASWVGTAFTNAPVTAISINSAGTIYVGIYEGTFRGAEGSSTWAYTYDNRFYSDTVHALYLSPTNDIVAGGDRIIGWYKVGDANWHSELGFMQHVHSIIPTPSHRIYFGGTYGGYIGSNGVAYLDDLENWALPVEGIVLSPVTALAVNASGWLFAATRDSGMLVSGNNGDTWGKLNSGLGSSVISCMEMSRTGVLYAGSFDGNVYEAASTYFGPIAPVKLYPRNDTLDVRGSIALRWRQVAGSLTYHLQVSRDSVFGSGIIVDQSLPDTSRIVASLDTVTRYYWRVRSQNPIDTSIYSDTWRFVTGPIPSPPALASPPDSSENIPASVQLRWHSVQTAISYRLETSGYPGFYYPTVYDTADTVINLEGLAPNIRIYWHVRATNIAGPGAFSDTWSFGSITPPQVEPRLEFPLAEATHLPTSVTFLWERSERATSYDFQLTDRNQFDSLFIRADSLLADTSLRVDGLTNGTRFKWRVRGRNKWGVGPFSDPREFITIIESPSAPTLISPSNHAVDVRTYAAELRWSPSERASSYHVQVATDSLFTRMWGENDVVSTTLSMHLRENTLYYWRVYALNIGGTSPWSPTFTFRTIPEGNGGSGKPGTYYVMGNFPSMFNGTTIFYFGTPVGTQVQITVYNILGQRVATVIDGAIPAGYWETSWDASGLPSGMYLYIVRLGDLMTTRRTWILK
jgi:hypothetical protein